MAKRLGFAERVLSPRLPEAGFDVAVKKLVEAVARGNRPYFVVHRDYAMAVQSRRHHLTAVTVRRTPLPLGEPTTLKLRIESVPMLGG